MNARFLCLSFLLVALGLGLLFVTAPVRADAAPNWRLKDLDGKTIQLSDFKGKVVILDFWATWCPPCRAEIPNFVALQTQYKKQGLVVIGISLDEGPPDVVSAFVKKNNIDYPIVLGNDEVTQQYGGVQAIPTTFVIDAQGNIVDKYVGETEKSVFEADIKKLLPAAVASSH